MYYTPPSTYMFRALGNKKAIKRKNICTYRNIEYCVDVYGEVLGI